jgi:hypothetical protein
MTNFTVKVRADQGNTGTNKIEVFLDTEPKQEIMVLTDRGDDIDEYEDEPRPQDTALYYAVERIAQLEKQLKALADAASPVLEDYANAIDCMEFPEEADESRDLHNDLKNALADAKQVLSR